MEQQNNPKLVIQKNQPVTIRLKSLTPFHEGEHPQWGKSYGYNVLLLDGDKYVEYTWWAKDAAKQIMEAAHIEAEEDFKLELRTGNSKEGNPYTIWLIDGDSKNDWINKPKATKEEFIAEVKEAINEPKVKEVVSQEVEYDWEAMRADFVDIKKRIKFLEDQAGITEDEDIPF